MEATWKKVKAAVKDCIPSHRYRMWIEPMQYKHCNKDCIILTCPNYFSRKRVLDHYSAIIKSEITKTTQKTYELIIEVSEENKKLSCVLPKFLHKDLNVVPISFQRINCG